MLNSLHICKHIYRESYTLAVHMCVGILKYNDKAIQQPTVYFMPILYHALDFLRVESSKITLTNLYLTKDNLRIGDFQNRSMYCSVFKITLTYIWCVPCLHATFFPLILKCESINRYFPQIL